MWGRIVINGAIQRMNAAPVNAGGTATVQLEAKTARVKLVVVLELVGSGMPPPARCRSLASASTIGRSESAVAGAINVWGVERWPRHGGQTSALCRAPLCDITSVAIVHNPRGIQGDNFSYMNDFAVPGPSRGRRDRRAWRPAAADRDRAHAWSSPSPRHCRARRATDDRRRLASPGVCIASRGSVRSGLRRAAADDPCGGRASYRAGEYACGIERPDHRGGSA